MDAQESHNFLITFLSPTTLRYLNREFFTIFLVKRFDALIKTICNAGASLVTYPIMLYLGAGSITGAFEKAERLKMILICIVMCEVIAYSLSERYQKIPKA